MHHTALHVPGGVVRSPVNASPLGTRVMFISR